MRTILFNLQSGQYEEIRPDQVASAVEGKKPLWFFATETMVIVACADWECPAEWMFGQFNMRGTAKSKGILDRIGLVQRDSVKASGYLLRNGDQLQVMEWQEMQHFGSISKAFLNECMVALGATEEGEQAREYHERRH